MVKKLIDLESGGILSISSICYISPKNNDERTVRTSDACEVGITDNDYAAIRINMNRKNGFFYMSIGLVLMIGGGLFATIDSGSDEEVIVAQTCQSIAIESSSVDVPEIKDLQIDGK